MLMIKNLRASVENKEILKGVDLVVKPGEVHAVMGPNGSGKSTLAYTLMGHPRYEIAQETKNKKQKTKIELDGEDVLKMAPDERAKKGLFLAFQYPVRVEGVSVASFLKNVYEKTHCVACRKGRGLEKCKHLSVLEFREILENMAKDLGVRRELLKRSLNDGFSGGEKKRVEILQMAVLDPKYAVLDETDSGLDVDALKIVAGGVSRICKKSKKMGVILITHYQRILKYIKPDKVHVMIGGKIVKSGGRELARELEKQGYKQFQKFN